MGTVADFANSDDMGWDVTKGHFLVHMVAELATKKFPDVILVVNADKMMLYNRKYVQVKVVKPKEDGSKTE